MSLAMHCVTKWLHQPQEVQITVCSTDQKRGVSDRLSHLLMII